MDINKVNNLIKNYSNEETLTQNTSLQNENTPDKSTEKNTGSTRDAIHISAASVKLQKIAEQIKNESEVNLDKVNAIKKKILDGTYPYLNTDPQSGIYEDLAQKMFQLESTLGRSENE